MVMRKKTEAEIEEIRNLRKQGCTIREIAYKKGYSFHTILKYLNVANDVANDVQHSENQSETNIVNNVANNVADVANVVANNVADVADNVANDVQHKEIQFLKEQIEKLYQLVYELQQQIYYILSLDNICINNIKNTTTKEDKEKEKNIIKENKEKNIINNNTEKEIFEKIEKELNSRERDVLLFWLSLKGNENFNWDVDISIIKQILALATPQQAKSVIFDKFFKLPEEKRNLDYFLTIFKSLNLRGKIKNKPNNFDKISFLQWLDENPSFDYRKIVPKLWKECSKEEKQTKLKAFYFAFNRAKEDKRVQFTQEDWKKYEQARKLFKEVF